MEINDELLEGSMEDVENPSIESESNEEVNSVDEDIHTVMESLNKDNRPKGENIYVEHDISSKNTSDDDDEEEDDLEDNSDDNNDEACDDNVEDDISDKNELNEYDVISSDHAVIDTDKEDDKNKNVVDDNSSLSDKTKKTVPFARDMTETLSDEIKNVNSDKEEDVLLSDFMDVDTDSFTFLERSSDGYFLCSLSLEDKKTIKQAVRSPNYIFRYPRLTLRDSVLGYKENKLDTTIHYDVYFPDYSLSFNIPCDYVKPYSQTFKDYFEDLVSRIRPDHLSIKHYNDSVTISSLKVVETGLLELTTENGVDKYLINNYDVSFYAILDYIRGISDQGSEHIELKMIPAYFRKI